MKRRRESTDRAVMLGNGKRIGNDMTLTLQRSNDPDQTTCRNHDFVVHYSPLMIGKENAEEYMGL